jgi:hypothetical protein
MLFEQGHQKLSGRKAGTLNRRTQARREMHALRAEAFNGNALGFLQQIYTDVTLPLAMRLDAARCAVAYDGEGRERADAGQ